jgi:hypothetical protein
LLLFEFLAQRPESFNQQIKKTVRIGSHGNITIRGLARHIPNITNCPSKTGSWNHVHLNVHVLYRKQFGFNQISDCARVVQCRSSKTVTLVVRPFEKLEQLCRDRANFCAERPEFFYAVWGGKALVRQVQSKHGQFYAAREDDAGGVRIAQNVEFGGWAGVP